MSHVTRVETYTLGRVSCRLEHKTDSVLNQLVLRGNAETVVYGKLKFCTVTVAILEEESRAE